jgi:cell division septum initiation protein DivIVA
MSVIDLLDQLEGLVVNGRRVVFTPNVMVNEDEALDLIDRARLELPDEIKEAHHTLEQQSQLLADAQATAERLVADAQEEAERRLGDARAEADTVEHTAAERAAALVSESEVVRAARARVEELLAEAEHKAGEVRAEADAYAQSVMTHLAEQLTKTLNTVSHGIDSLARAGSGGR